MRNTTQWSCCSVTRLNSMIYRCFCFKKSKKDLLEIKAYSRLEKEVSITNILKQLRVLKKLTSSSLGLESWRQALKSHGIKDYSLKFSDSEDEQVKAERKQRNRALLANAFRKRLGLSDNAEQVSKDAPGDSNNILGFAVHGKQDTPAPPQDSFVTHNASEVSFVNTTKVNTTAVKESSLILPDKQFDEIARPNSNNLQDILDTLEKSDNI